MMASCEFLLLSDSYVPSDGHCVIPDYDNIPLDFTKRLSLHDEPVDGAEYYMFNPVIVATGNLVTQSSYLDQ